MKKIIILFVVLLAVLVGFALQNLYSLWQSYQKNPTSPSVNSFDECVAAGNPVMESYPARCSTSDGKSFTQYIGNETEYNDEIQVDSPRPNVLITSPVTVSGKARGNWFFEGSFSGELFDRNNKSLGVVVLQAEGEWMTEEFVPFSGELTFQTPEIERGTLIIKNANPSGLPEMEKTLIIPVQFK